MHEKGKTKNQARIHLPLGPQVILDKEYEGDEYLQTIQQICQIDEVKTLGLTNNGITIKGIKVLSTLPWCNLQTLILESNRIGDMGCKYLSRVRISSLKTLVLSNCDLGGSGLKHLSKAQWGALNFLNLKRNMTIVEDLAPLTRTNWKLLNQIQISGQKSEATTFLENLRRARNNQNQDVQIIIACYGGRFFIEYTKFALSKRKNMKVR